MHKMHFMDRHNLSLTFLCNFGKTLVSNNDEGTVSLASISKKLSEQEPIELEALIDTQTVLLRAGHNFNM